MAVLDKGRSKGDRKWERDRGDGDGGKINEERERHTFLPETETVSIFP